MSDTCPNCGATLKRDGDQPNIVRGTMSTLGSCHNPDCETFESTFSFGERQMTRLELDKYAAIRAKFCIKETPNE